MMKFAYRPSPESLAQCYALLASALFLVTGILYLSFGFLPMIHHDFWRSYDVLLNHSWWQAALLKFNGHSLFFPTLLWEAHLYLFHGSQAVLFFVGLALLLATCALLIVPIWRDAGWSLTAKLAATLVLIIGNFWMARAGMLESAPFSCAYSLTMASSLLAFLWLPEMSGSPHSRLAAFIVLGGGFFATFSLGSGLLVWPTLLLLGWGFRLPYRFLTLVTLAMIGTAIIYALLPPHYLDQPMIDPHAWFATGAAEEVGQFCRLLGAPVALALSAWREGMLESQAAQKYPFALWGGVIGIAWAIAAVVPHLWRRDVAANRRAALGLALVTFDFLVFVMIVLSRNQRNHEVPNEIIAPRYIFWSTLFWAGLFILGLDWGERHPRWRRLGLLVALTIPILVWPEHTQKGLQWRRARFSATAGEAMLITGVADPAKILFADQSQIDRVVPQLRAHRLDLFASGWQDYVGQPLPRFFHGQEDLTEYRAEASVSRLLGSKDDRGPMRVNGAFSSKSVPSLMVIVDSRDTIAGIARSCPMINLMNRWLYHGQSPRRHLTGYILSYDPALQYYLRAVGERDCLSQIAIPITSLPR
ncbi:MAG: hypothetical protein H0X40_09055 [Chthoniobacterales bacterium]|nr:hypothetical protein [Chthoniobacterales bacterium]